MTINLSLISYLIINAFLYCLCISNPRVHYHRDNNTPCHSNSPFRHVEYQSSASTLIYFILVPTCAICEYDTLQLINFDATIWVLRVLISFSNLKFGLSQTSVFILLFEMLIRIVTDCRGCCVKP